MATKTTKKTATSSKPRAAAAASSEPSVASSVKLASVAPVESTPLFAHPIAPPLPGKKVVLHVGCGQPNPEKLHATFRSPDWQEVRMDIDPGVKPDILGDMTDMHAVENASVDAVWSSHNVEHVYAHQVAQVLSEFYRVIKPHGFVLITLPDIQAVAEYVAQGKLESPIYNSPAGPINALDIIYGYGRSIAAGNHFMAHRTAFTAETLGVKVRQAGFTNVQVRRDFLDLWVIGQKLPEDAPNRSDKIMIMQDPKRAPGVKAPVPSSKGGPSDALDVEPVMWKPLPKPPGFKDL